MKEIWRDIKDYEGYYQVSNFGNVKSLDRKIIQEDSKRHQYLRTIKGRLLKQTNNGRGYKNVTLVKDNKKKQGLVHRLVAEAFIFNPNNYPVINHIDGNKHNNKITNLEYCSHKHNINEAIRLGLLNPREHSCKKCIQKDFNGNVINTYKSITEASKSTGICIGNISATCLGNQKYAGKYKWEFLKE